MGSSSGGGVGSVSGGLPHRGGLSGVVNPHRGNLSCGFRRGVNLLDPPGTPPAGKLLCYLVGTSPRTSRVDYPVTLDRGGGGSFRSGPGGSGSGCFS